MLRSPLLRSWLSSQVSDPKATASQPFFSHATPHHAAKYSYLKPSASWLLSSLSYPDTRLLGYSAFLLFHSSTLSASGNAKGTTVDDHLATLVVKLQLLGQSAGKSIDESSSKLLQELPRAMIEIERVGSDATLLAQQMAQVLDKVSEVERTGQQTVAALATLDAIKSRMEECAATLQEAESVSKVLSQIEPLFQVDELKQIASRLGSLRRSLQAMGNLEEFSHAEERLKAFEDRLEKRVSNKLKEGIEQLDTGATKECLAIYEQMQRRDVLMTRYVQARKPHLVKIYSTFADDKETAVVDRLRQLSEELKQALKTELEWCLTVFPDSSEFASALWTDLMGTVASPMQQVLVDRIFKGSYGEKELAQMRSIHPVVVDLAVSGAEMLIDPKVPGAHPDKRDILRVGLGLIERCQREYCDKEGAVLGRRADTLRVEITACQDITHGLRVAEGATGSFFAEAQNSATRSFSFTCGAESLAVARMLDEAVSQHIDSIRKGLVQFRVIIGLENTQRKPEPQPSKVSEPTDADAKKKDDDDLDLLEEEGIGFDAADGQDFTHLQEALAFLRFSETIPSKVRELDQHVREQVCKHGKTLFTDVSLQMARDHPPSVYILSDTSRLPQLQKYIARAQNKEFQTLMRSPTVVQALHAKVEELLLDISLVFVRKQLSNLPKLRVWGENKKAKGHLPTFSASPLNYITQIAEYLFSLPDQLDPSGQDDGGDGGETDHDFMHHWLSRITECIVQEYIQQILAVPSLSSSGRLQLAEDMKYLSSVLETLGSPGLESLQELLKLIEATDENFPQACVSVSSLDRNVIDKISRKRQAGLAS